MFKPSLFLLVVLIIQGAWSLVSQTPRKIPRDSDDEIRVITAANVKGNASAPTSINGVRAITPPPLPVNLKVEVRVKPGAGALPRFSFYLAIVRNMARCSFQPWHQDKHLFHFEPEEHVAFDFVSGTRPPLYEIGYVLWTFIWIFTDSNKRGLCTEAQWVTKMLPDVLGVGKVYLSVEDSISDPQNSTISVASQNGSDIFSTSIETNDTTIVASPPAQFVGPATATNGPGLQLKLGYKEGGEGLNVEGVWLSALYLIITAAQFEPQDQGDIVWRYDPDARLTMAIFPYNQGSPDEFKWWMVAETMPMMMELMLQERRGGRWSEARARLQENGVNVARVLILKGRVDPDQLDSAFTALDIERDDAESGDGINVQSSKTDAVFQHPATSTTGVS